jgi:hypothetical protein
LKTKGLYLLVAVVAIGTVVYPLAYAYYTNQQLNAPYLCAPLIPCQPPSPGVGICRSLCFVKIANATFSPGTIVVAPGATVVWENLDGVAHSVTPLNGSAWSSTLLRPGGSFSFSVPNNLRPGDYYYHCNIHPAMVGILEAVA